MKRSTVRWLIVAAVLILLGCLLFGGVMMKLRWDFSKLSNVSYETNTYPLTEEYTHIFVKTNTADMVFVPTGGNETTVSCFEPHNMKHTVCVRDDTLTVELVDTRAWFEHITLVDFNTPKIVVTLPAATYGSLTVAGNTGDLQIPSRLTFDDIDVKVHTGNVQLDTSAVGAMTVETTTGWITAQNINAASLDLSASTGRICVSGIACEGDVITRVSTGKTLLSDVTCRNLHSAGTTGDLTLTNVVASGSFTLKRDTGDITFDGADAASIRAATSTGDITGRLLSGKTFHAHTSTGTVDVPQNSDGGSCEFSTSTGNIRVTVGK